MLHADNIEGDWIYDIETYPNCFTFTIIRSNGTHLRTFEISDRKNEIEGLLKCFRYIRDNNQRMVGFNNLGFDYPVIHYIIEKAIAARKAGEQLEIDVKEIYDVAMKQIYSFKGDGFGNTVKDKDVKLKQVDLFKIYHFDNKQRSTSLKMIEFNRRSKNIEDLPFDVGRDLTSDEMDELIRYNIHDVKETLGFYHDSVDAIRFRSKLSEQFGMDFTNHNDAKIGADYFINHLEKQMPGSCYKWDGYRRKLQQSKRDVIHINECLFDYYDFKRPEFQAMLKWFKQQTITETKGVFTKIEEHLLGDVAQYTNMRRTRKKFPDKPTEQEIEEFKQLHPLGWVEKVKLKSKKDLYSYWGNWNIADALNVVVDGFEFVFGAGGIHGSVESSIVRADDEYDIIDADVASMYPNIAIANRVYPEHLSDKFCDIYQDVYEQRKQYPKKSAENALLKLALNGVYGKSNSKYSPFFDPKYTMTTTINGQLSLCLLAERLLEIEGVSLIQVNTDGVTVKCPKTKRDEYYAACQEWEQDVGLDLEYADYQAMYIRDVNNYIGLFMDGKTKNKGAYVYKTRQSEGKNWNPEHMDWNQNMSALVIPMAAEAAMVRGQDVEEFIRNHKNEYDFMLRTKVPRSSRLVVVDEEGVDHPQQNICRYYPSKGGKKLIKIMPPLPGKEEDGERRLSIDKDWSVKTCNNMEDFDWDIDYDYYIEGAKKLILEETH